jgi:phosphoglycerate dehydrogenase-like enzyme
MKPTALFVNTARADLVDPQALVVLSPHVGYVTHEGFEVFFGGAAEQIEMFVTGRTPSRVVNQLAEAEVGPATR